MSTPDVITLRSGPASATVSTRGAEALTWQAGGRDLLWQPDPALWREVSPLLFPVVGWTRHGRVRVGCRLYPLALHGFARHLDYTVVARGGDFVRMAITDNALTRSLYPFAFAFTAEYRLSARGLDMALVVENRGPGPMPYACGLHPGFRWPFAGGRQEDYRIVFARDEKAQVPVLAPGGLIARATRGVPLQGRVLPLSPKLFEGDALCFLDAASDNLRFEGLGAEEAVQAALKIPSCLMVNRNQGAGTRILIDGLLGSARPDGYWNQPRSHNAVAAAVAQHRADWGMTIAPVAHANRLGFIPYAEEQYDLVLVSARRARPAVEAFLASLRSEESRDALEQAGFRPA